MKYLKLFELFNGIISEDLQYHIDHKIIGDIPDTNGCLP